MNVNSIFISQKDLERTQSVYALASTQVKQGFDSQHVSLDMLIDDLQMKCNEVANAMVNMQEAVPGKEPVDPIELRATWRAYMIILNELKLLKVMV